MNLSQKTYSTLLFDLDGTLVDSGEGIMRCAQHALAAFGISVADWHTLRAFVGPPLEDSFSDFYGFDKADTQRAVEVYRERYFSKGVFEQVPYEGVFDTLRQIRQCGYRIGLATSKMQRQANFVTGELFPDFAPLLDGVYARDDEGVRYTKADVVRHALGELEVNDLSRVLMIGDRKFDIHGAHECGIDALGVLYGYGDRAEMEAAGADYVCESMTDLLQFLQTHYSA